MACSISAHCRRTRRSGKQRGSYRSIYQMGMGLKAQLIAALDSR